MTYVRNFVYVTAAVVFALVARTSTDVTVDARSAEGARPSQTVEAARSGATGAKYVTQVGSATVYAETAEQVAEVEFVMGRFAEYDLDLPAMEIRYFGHPERCKSDDGRWRAGFTAFGGGSYVVYNCGTVFTLLHEVAHVWDVYALDDETRERFISKRDADSWTHDEWARAGGEHLADVLAWGLQDGNVRPSRTTPNDDDSLFEAFVIATGRDPFH